MSIFFINFASLKLKSMKRLYSIDVLRGLALAGMLLVNNPGSWSHIYPPFEHADFIGLTLADLVFPTFMFVMGMCIPLALRKYTTDNRNEALRHIFIRTLMIFGIGLFLQWMSRGFCAWSELRIPGVLQRLAICYGICAAMTLYIKPKYLVSIAVIILVGYSFLLSFFNGYEWSEMNIISRVDHYLLGANHLYIDNGIRLDPEGILSTLPCISHVLFGVIIMSEWLRLQKEETDPMIIYKKFVKYILTFAITTIFIVFLDVYDSIPVCKKVWSASFVMVTITIAILILSALIWLIDIKKWSRWGCSFFAIFGRYPLLLYIISWIMADLFGQWGITWNLYNSFCNFCSPEMASLLYAICFVLFHWIIALGINVIKKRN